MSTLITPSLQKNRSKKLVFIVLYLPVVPVPYLPELL